MKIGQTVRFSQIPPGTFFFDAGNLCFKFPHSFKITPDISHNIMNHSMGRTDYRQANWPVEYAGSIEDIRDY